jgi:ATP-binding cassette subfamily B (MDR/TAP) protein 1
MFTSSTRDTRVANSSNPRLSLKHVAEGGTLAEESVSTIRTAHAFGTQHALASLYDVAVQKAYQVECLLAISQGIGLGMFFFAMYAAYGLGEFGFFVRSQAQLISSH